MKSLKFILAASLCASFLTACGCSADENHENTTATEEVIEEVTNKPDRNNNTVGDVIDDAGNVVEDAGDAVDDTADSIGNTVR